MFLNHCLLCPFNESIDDFRVPSNVSGGSLRKNHRHLAWTINILKLEPSHKVSEFKQMCTVEIGRNLARSFQGRHDGELPEEGDRRDYARKRDKTMRVTPSKGSSLLYIHSKSTSYSITRKPTKITSIEP
jgi:hypothetical protein